MVAARIHVGWRKFRELSAVQCGQKWLVKLKGKMNKTYARTAMTYCGETWAVRIR